MSKNALVNNLEREPGKELSAGELINLKVQALLEYVAGASELDEKQHPYKVGKTLWQRETHNKEGEHIFVSYNDHSQSENYIAPQFFIQVFGANHTRTTPQIIDDIRWTAEDDPAQMFADNLNRIEDLLSLFKTSEAPNA